jgi:hypothetical protein
MALERLPVDPERRWRWYQVAATASAGVITSLTTVRLSGGAAGALAAVITQASYGFSFTAYDPYSAEPMVFVIAALIAWCWMEDRWRTALAAGLIGIFAKETVALVSLACVVAAAIDPQRSTRRAWMLSGLVVFATLLLFRWVMDTFFGWGIDSSPAAQLWSGSWLALWWRNNPFLIRKIYLLFVPFGFAWLFAGLALRRADARLRRLAFSSAIPILALCYVQTPERALSTVFFVIAPLAAAYVVRAPPSLAALAVVANAVVTAKVGSSTAWLPPSQYSIIPAVSLAAWCIWTIERKGEGREQMAG